MIVPINPAKLAVPPGPARYLPRRRLEGRWKEWAERSLVLVTAGAGFGKTSFLAAGARASRRPVIWYSLDEEDTGLGVFAATLHAAFSSTTPESVEVPEGGAAGFAGRFLSESVRRMSGKGGERWIVLDDAHHLAGSGPVLRFLERWIRFLPPRSSLILASREPLPIASMKTQSAGQAARLGAADLTFDSGETAALFRLHHPRARLSGDVARRVAERTEGWPAGIEILFQSLGRPTSRAVDEALEGMTGGGRGWFAFFAEEVLRSLDPDLREFLIRSAVLPRLDGDLCDRLLRAEGSRLRLEELHRRNLFTYRTQEGGEVFRYHRIFREVLLEHLERERKGEARRLRKRAATLLGRAGAWADAVVVRSEEGDGEATLRLVEKAGEDLLRSGRVELVRRALAALPAGLLDDRPAALLLLGKATGVAGRWDEAERIFRKALRVCPPGARRLELTALLAQTHLRRGDNRKCRALCEKALAEPGPKPADLRLDLLGMLGVSACELGRLDEGEEVLRRARSILRKRRKGGTGEAVFYLLPGNIHFRRGDFVRAKEAVREGLVHFRRVGDARRVCHCLGVLAHVTAETADSAGAAELAREGLRIAESLDYPIMKGFCLLALARCALVDNDPEEARVRAEEARALGESLGDVGLRTISMTRLAEAAAAAGNRRGAIRLAEAALDASRRLRDLYQEAENRMLLGVLLEKKDPEEASANRRRAERTIRRVGMGYHLHRLLLIRLAAGDVPGRTRRKAIGELLAGTAVREQDFLFLRLERERAVSVLADAFRLGIETDRAASLLGEIGAAAVPVLAPLLESGDERLAIRTADLLARIGGEDAHAALARHGDEETPAGKAAGEGAAELEDRPEIPLRIRAFGPLRIRAGGRVLDLGDWKSARALRLFQFLLVHRFRWLPRDEVIEALWPEAEPAKGANNLRQTIHLLRKTLEPERRGARDSRYIPFHKEAIRLDPGAGYAYDAEEFDRAFREGEDRWRAGDRRKAEEGYRRAVEIHRGDFLADAPFEEFAAEERERIRGRLLRAIRRLLEILASAKRWEEVIPLSRTGISHDPFCEEFHERLVTALHRLGNRREALREYQRYEETMMTELDLLPSRRMKELAERVTSRPNREAPA